MNILKDFDKRLSTMLGMNPAYIEESKSIRIPIEDGKPAINLMVLYRWKPGEYRVMTEHSLVDVPLKTSQSAAEIANYLEYELSGWHNEVYVHAVPRHGDGRQGLGTIKTAAEFIDDTDRGIYGEEAMYRE